MSRLLAVTVLVVAACGADPGGDGGGPQLGVWQIDTAPVEDWFCTRAGTVCTPPTYFTPLPSTVEIATGGVLTWIGLRAHTGVVEGDCIRIPPATEEGVERAAATFCNLVLDGVVDESRAFASIGWSLGTANECTCSSHFDFEGGE